MNGVRPPRCANWADKKKTVRCGCDRDAHHAERVSSPDGIPRVEYLGCLNHFCNCKRYIPEGGI